MRYNVLISSLRDAGRQILLPFEESKEVCFPQCQTILLTARICTSLRIEVLTNHSKPGLRM